MIIILKDGAKQEQIQSLVQNITNRGLTVHESIGSQSHILGVIGDTSMVDTQTIINLECVSDVKRVSEPYKAVNRKFHPEDTIVDISGRKVGEGYFNMIAGPCSVESEEQIIEVAKRVKASGASMLRGGAYKPRTSPYAFQGLKQEGIKLLLAAKKETGLPIVTELTNIMNLKYFDEVDVIQVGARNMQNFDMLYELGHSNKPILLKRGLSSTIEEWLMSAEYIMSGGNQNVILCERGIRTYETATRNTFDISAVPILKRLSHLPIIVDPSHATGKTWLVEPLVRAAIGAGADGAMIEVHNNPSCALCDGAQSITPDTFDTIMKDVKLRVKFEGKILV